MYYAVAVSEKNNVLMNQHSGPCLTEDKAIEWAQNFLAQKGCTVAQVLVMRPITTVFVSTPPIAVQPYKDPTIVKGEVAKAA